MENANKRARYGRGMRGWRRFVILDDWEGGCGYRTPVDARYTRKRNAFMQADLLYYKIRRTKFCDIVSS